MATAWDTAVQASIGVEAAEGAGTAAGTMVVAAATGEVLVARTAVEEVESGTKCEQTLGGIGERRSDMKKELSS